MEDVDVGLRVVFACLVSFGHLRKSWIISSGHLSIRRGLGPIKMVNSRTLRLEDLKVLQLLVYP